MNPKTTSTALFLSLLAFVALTPPLLAWPGEAKHPLAFVFYLVGIWILLWMALFFLELKRRKP